jgi:hypothetical protein
MRRRLFTLLSALSLLLCVAVGVLWVRSYSAPALRGELPVGGHRLFHWRGQVVWLHHRANVAPPWAWVRTTVYLSSGESRRGALVKALVCDPADPIDLRNRTGTLLSRPYVIVDVARGVWRPGGGFEIHTARLQLPRGDYSGPPGLWTWEQSAPVVRGAAVPYWALAALLLAPPARAAWRARRRDRRRARGQCPACGYDLRASAGRCPECGAVAAAGV